MSYLYYIGIDIGKETIDVAVHGQKTVTQYANNSSGFRAFKKRYTEELPDSFVVLEATGGYENALVSFLQAEQVAVHRASPLAAKHFLRSLRLRAKTDRLDALALARYGAERHSELALLLPPEPAQQRLAELVARRDDLVKMRVMEKQRLKHPRYKNLQPSLKQTIKFLTTQIENLEQQMRHAIAACKTLTRKMHVLMQITGIGFQTAANLLAKMPELGTLSRKQAASLAGLAPHPKDSGKSTGYRSTTGGRSSLKSNLYPAAMSAKTHCPSLKTFYQNLRDKGKLPMVALTAVMRKLIIIANAKIRDDLFLNHGR